eukprot:748715-Hanusia_phi.AAC.4
MAGWSSTHLGLESSFGTYPCGSFEPFLSQNSQTAIILTIDIRGRIFTPPPAQTQDLTPSSALRGRGTPSFPPPIAFPALEYMPACRLYHSPPLAP